MSNDTTISITPVHLLFFFAAGAGSDDWSVFPDEESELLVEVSVVSVLLASCSREVSVGD
jgi:hypothetical protein